MQFRSPPPLPTFCLSAKDLLDSHTTAIAAFWCRLSVNCPCSSFFVYKTCDESQFWGSTRKQPPGRLHMYLFIDNFPAKPNCHNCSLTSRLSIAARLAAAP